ncbi:MAG: zinc metallopeptidase [Anaerolineales bacterium]|nr:zinc metallopeptidase [Anaerolineales bacterium]MBP6208714.1 zinc metallopeptidase [Anaerolineales bacterium]MBP8164397.1 zinc metallopeptidase [Anaerolineales bacterium]
MFFDPTYLIFMIPAFILMGLTSWYVRSAYSKWSRVAAQSRLTGAQAAQRLMSTGGMYGLQIRGVAGELTDHYDPRNKTLFLSNGVANGASVASLAIAAHELGHAMQDAEDYFPLRFRSALVPLVNIGSNLGWILIMIGLFLNFTQLAWVGVMVFAGGAVFALATLPVEFDASARAKQLLVQTGIIQTEQEQRGVNAVLNAAALTYVAGLVTAILQLLYYVSLISGRSRD